VFPDLVADPRFIIQSITQDATTLAWVIVGYIQHAKIKGFGGDAVTPNKIWVATGQVNPTSPTAPITPIYTALPCTTSVYGGVFTITVPTSGSGLNLTFTQWFIPVAILPTPSQDSALTLQLTHVPYQGEGVLGRNYTVVFAPDQALVTTNGTGAAPIVGLADVFPFNREFPIAPTLPSLPFWDTSDLTNQPLLGDVDSNYVAKKFSNVEHTFGMRLFTNDFIAPLYGYMRRTIQLLTQGAQGFASATPHVGFAIPLPLSPSAVGKNLTTTTGPVALYVDNTAGSDSNDGLTPATALQTIQAALSTLPPVIRNPVNIYLLSTTPFTLGGTNANVAQANYTQVSIDDSGADTLNYCLGEFAFSMQESAKITIGRLTPTSPRVIIDANNVKNQSWASVSPVSAFIATDCRVTFSGICFQNFQVDAAVLSEGSDIVFDDCEINACATGVAASRNSRVTFLNGSASLADGNHVVVAAHSAISISGTTLANPAGLPSQTFFLVERSSSLDLSNHSAVMETYLTSQTLVAWAQMNSTIICQPSWSSAGGAKITSGSVLDLFTRATAIPAFAGSIQTDASTTTNTISGSDF
jgi:hypothetical protein